MPSNKITFVCVEGKIKENHIKVFDWNVHKIKATATKIYKFVDILSKSSGRLNPERKKRITTKWHERFTKCIFMLF